MSTWFRFTPTTTCNNALAPSVVQALEFSVSKWLGGMRWEFALQWENVSDSAGDGAPQWRWWDGHNWLPLVPAFPQCLTGDTWHHLLLTGSIVGGRVHYGQLGVDGAVRPLGMTASPVADPLPDQLAVGFQLDGNETSTPYSLLADRVDLNFRSGTDGDYDGDGDTDVAVFRPSTGLWYVLGGSPAALSWGTNGDEPTPLPSAIRQPSATG